METLLWINAMYKKTEDRAEAQTTIMEHMHGKFMKIKIQKTSNHPWVNVVTELLVFMCHKFLASYNYRS
jgi:hypothetical protein